MRGQHTRAVEYLAWRAIPIYVCAVVAAAAFLFVGEGHPVLHWVFRTLFYVMTAWSLWRTAGLVPIFPVWVVGIDLAIAACCVLACLAYLDDQIPEDEMAQVGSLVLIGLIVIPLAEFLAVAVMILFDVRPSRNALKWFDGNAQTIRFLLADGASADVTGRGYSPLHFAMASGDRDLVEELIAGGADPNAKGRFLNGTPLHCLRNADAGMVALLLDAGAEVNARDRSGRTPLHGVCALGKKELAELLVARGAEVNARDFSGWTPLGFACFRRHEDVIEFLSRHAAEQGEQRESKSGNASRPAMSTLMVIEVGLFLALFVIGAYLVLCVLYPCLFLPEVVLWKLLPAAGAYLAALVVCEMIRWVAWQVRRRRTAAGQPPAC